jgi:hypothetical protein
MGLENKIKTTLTGIEMFRKELDRAEAGDNMGALLRGVKREQIKRGMVIAAPGSIKATKKFLAQFYVRRIVPPTVSLLTLLLQILTKDEGGRYNPFMIHYRPQVYIRTSDITTGFEWPEGSDGTDEKMVSPFTALSASMLIKRSDHAGRQCRACLQASRRCRRRRWNPVHNSRGQQDKYVTALVFLLLLIILQSARALSRRSSTKGRDLLEYVPCALSLLYTALRSA